MRFTRRIGAAISTPLRRLLGDPSDFPNTRGPAGLGEIALEYAIYHSPLGFVRTLLELGADPNYDEPAGFPSLMAALSTVRNDRYELVELLLAFGADVRRRGINDETPLHRAATDDDLPLIALLWRTVPIRSRRRASTTARRRTRSPSSAVF
ncbi:MAG: ankyrin repeat domain-containing protein [Candidatus Elarobacter sp.]